MVTQWEDGHFVGGHPALDLANTVFNRAHPVPDNELLRTPSDVLAWCTAAGVPAAADPDVAEVRAVREQVWAVFDALARGGSPPDAPVGALMERAGAGLRTGSAGIPAVLSLLAVRALFTLPAERIRACGRCGWLFLDSSRGGRRRWCSMSTCGNREKAGRHRRAVRASGA
ncbi:CGNR zinc finger domain-containing protein [Amycolatopsis suaedae]|nr:ABATE domain-containing protein [Amycolatopsis suaedae]